MANTYTKMILELIFAVKYRDAMINENWENKLYDYLIEKMESKNHLPIIVNGVPDHIHILVQMHPNQSVSELLQMLKGYSSGWINELNYTQSKFAWQDGYTAFSHAPGILEEIKKHIANQKIIHKGISFREELINYFANNDVIYDNRYILKDPE